MNNKQNLHTHTTYADGKDTPEELILEAIKREFSSIGFSEHSFNKYSSYPYQMKLEKLKDYVAEISELKEKYRGEIDVFCGLEFEIFSDVPKEHFDYFIGSVHYLETKNGILGFDAGYEQTVKYINENFGGSGISFAEKYFATLCSLPEKMNFDILGHFDIITKNNEKGDLIDTSDKKYLNYGYEAIHTLAGKIPFFEVNTGAISRGYTSLPYPQMEFLKEFKKCGFGAMISSDCHDKNFIDCYFEQSKQLLLQAGFDTLWILTDDGYVEAKI